MAQLSIIGRRSQYAVPMLKPAILTSAVHSNGTANPFTIAIVDDPNDGETKLVVMFEGSGDIAVLSMDSLVNEEDISEKKHITRADRLEEVLREMLDSE